MKYTVPNSLIFNGILGVDVSVLNIIPRGWFGFYGIVKYKFFFSFEFIVNIYFELPSYLNLKFIFVLLTIIARQWIVIIFDTIYKFLNICLGFTSTPIVVNKSIFLPLYYLFIHILRFCVIPIPLRLNGWLKSIIHPSPHILNLDPNSDPIITISSSCYADFALCPPST